ncbi:MAG: multifunctional acyl-CoA thioesterase and protease and lysophospholipase, partial [Myxococcaceae bacterium]|nr:multifunctional acyl-CoA thioesterase and protease and lysophospholipase [Myxococcaceae bacterium]
AGPTAPRSAADWERFVPPLDAATLAHVREVFARGAAAGMRPDVFSKLGDSITESGSFAQDLGHGWYELGEFASLEPVIAWFRRRTPRGREENAFTRASAAATAGWESAQLLEGGDRCPVERELRTMRGAFAVLMVGTNDAERAGAETLATNLAAIVDRAERRGVVVLLSTIPAHHGSPAARAEAAAINDRIRALAASRHLPLIDYHAALAGVPSEGVSDDRVHPSVFVENGDTRAAVFTAEGLRYGYNVRNLTLLIGLRRVLDAAGVGYASR